MNKDLGRLKTALFLGEFMKKKIICLILSFALVSDITYLFTYYNYKDEIKFCEKNQQLLEVIDDVKENFYLDVDDEEMTYNMIAGVVNGLDDKFTYYHNYNQCQEINVNHSITLKSSGFQIDKDRTENILVTEVKENSQAEKMGLCTGDLIVEINGQNVIETGYYDIISELLGKDKTFMDIVVQRGENIFPVRFERRNIIEKYSDVQYKMLDDDTLYYKFNVFDDSTVANFEKAVEENNGNIKNVVFDLRENNGGVTEVCVDFFDLFSDSGSCVKNVYSKSEDVEIWETTDGIKYDFNVVLLVSNNTISCGEILPTLFRDTGKGIIVGQQTKGKGVFQLKTRLDDFTTYSIVAGYYYVNDLPNYNNIGISPDIEIPMDNSLIGTDDDIQLKKAIEILEK